MFNIPQITFPSFTEGELAFLNHCNNLSSKRSKEKKTVPPPTNEILSSVNLESVIFPNSDDYQIDPEKMDNYLASMMPNIVPTLKVLLEQTRYVKASEIVKIMDTMLNNFIAFLEKEGDKDKPFYIFFPTNFSSENIYVIFLWKKLKTLNIKGFVTSDYKFPPNEKVNLLVFDDCVFTGQNIDRLLYDFYENNKSSINDKLLTVDLFVAYVSNVGLEFLNEASKNPSYTIPLVCHINEIIPDVQFDEEFMNLCNEFHGSRLPLYLDYKIPMTTCDYLYEGINPITLDEVGYTTKNQITSDFKNSVYQAYLSACDS